MHIARSILALLILALVVTGCSTYYRITDSQTGRLYYTTSFSREPNNVRFKDQTGQEVTVPAVSKVESISEDEYRSATKK
jgi:hypothetical protein